MSTETTAWAKRQKCGNPTTKALLLELANWANPDGTVKFRNVKVIAELMEIAPRTVQRHLARLEEPTLDYPDRLGLIRRVEHFRDDGGQSANGFELIGYQMPYAKPDDKVSPPPMTETTPGDDNVTGDGVTPVSPLKGDKINTPTHPKGCVVPTPKSSKKFSRKKAGTRLPEDWTPPALEVLTASARKFVQQWPSGAYETVCEVFRLHYVEADGPTAIQTNWNRVLCKWLVKDHGKIMRDAKAGVSFAAMAPVKAKAPPAKRVAIISKGKEDDRSRQAHAILRKDLGQALYSQWFEPFAILFDGDELHVLVNSEFACQWIADRFHTRLGKVGSQVVKGRIAEVVVRLDSERAKVAA